MKITMIDTRRIDDGITLHRLMAGETYDVADSAARAEIRNGHAVCAEPPKSLDDVWAEIIAENKRAASGKPDLFDMVKATVRVHDALAGQL